MNSLPPEDDAADEIDPEKYAELQQKIDEAHDAFLKRHLKRVWPRNALRLLGVLQILVALAFVGVDLPIVLMFAPRWQVFAGCWAALFALLAGIMTIRSTVRSTWLKLNWTLVINVIGVAAAGGMLAFDILYLINPNVCVSLSGCNYLSYTFSAAKPFYIAQTALGAGFILTVIVFVICYIKFGLAGSTLFDNIQKGWVDPLREPMLEPYRPPPQVHPMYRPRMMMARPPFIGVPPDVNRPPMVPGMMMMPGMGNPRIMLRPRLPYMVAPMRPPMMAMPMTPIGQ